LKKSEKAREISENSPYNRVARRGKSKEFAIISSSSAFNYAVESVKLLGLDVNVLKLGMTHPLPEKMIGKFLRKHEKIVVVEELEPYLEMQVKAIAKDYAPDVEVYGKMSELYFPRDGEFSTRIVAAGLVKISGRKVPVDFGEIEKKYAEVVKGLPSRPPILCAGCPHRASFYVTRKVAGEKASYSTDIGCYALGIASPLKVGDIMTCMGASIGTAEGIRKATDSNTLAIIGDSTFFHAGIPGLINAVYNNHRIVVVVLDNLATAMTGHQPHPGTGMTGMQSPAEKVSIEKVAEGCGVKFVRVVDPFDVKEAEAVLREALRFAGPSVVVFRSPCTLMVVRERRHKGELLACRISDKCTDCMACIRLLGCPALIVEEDKVGINEALCSACGLCASICPYQAIDCVKMK
jgi:indolepyruvate ferredoxin oxidoreductase alpha subunit